jgi:hypothetical protein
MLHIFQLIVFGFLALVIVISLLALTSGVLGSLFQRGSYASRLRGSVVKVSCGHGPSDRIETLTGSGGYCRACESQRERLAERDWESRKIELMRDHPPPKWR